MKLDALLNKDSTNFDASEWSCHLELGPLKGSMSCTLVDHLVHTDGSIWLRYSFTAPIDLTFIGYTVRRIYTADDGTVVVRTVRQDVWTPAFVCLQGATVEVELVAEPADFT